MMATEKYTVQPSSSQALTGTSSSSSAAGLLALLDESDESLKIHALSKLNQGIHVYWAETGDKLSQLEIMFEDESLQSQTRELAALLLSQVYFHLGDLDESLSFALSSGEAFERMRHSSSSEYVSCVISQCIETYIRARSENSPVDSHLEAIINSLFESSLQSEQWAQTIGIAVECQRLDVIQKAFLVAQDPAVLRYALNTTLDSASLSVEKKNLTLEYLLPLFSHSSLSNPDYASLIRIYVRLRQPLECAKMLQSLLSSEKQLIAYQLAFNLVELSNQDQKFLKSVSSSISNLSMTEPASQENTDTNMESENQEEKPLLAAVVPTEVSKEQSVMLEILSGQVTVSLQRKFLKRCNKTDLLILNNSKTALEGKTSLYHTAISLSHAFMFAGTTDDKWMRSNIEFLGKAYNWSKFTATAAIGVVNQGNIEKGQNILKPYLPKSNGPAGSAYSEGGALFGLGLIYANCGHETIKILEDQLQKPGANEVIQHGAALGLGLAGMATADSDSYAILRDVMFNDQAVAGEACAYAMGLIMLGSGDKQCLDEMLQYARETHHEKIVRGLAIGIAFILYNRGANADSTIEVLLSEKEPILRYGGVYAIAMAYVGTGSSFAVKKLLQTAVSDVNDDVRRAAVTCLGFILCRTPSQVPKIVKLLSESYNPAVRYGSCLAIGIACAGTASKEALDILEPLAKDPTDYVRQAAYMSTAMVLVQANEVSCSTLMDIKSGWAKVIADKHEDPMAKFGASVAQGIIDAGGRNVTLSMVSHDDSTRMPAVIGFALFAQIWYWFPLAHCLSLSFSPTAIIGVTQELKVPKFSFTSNAKPSKFAYVPVTKEHVEEKLEKVATAVLSTTVKATARQKEKEKGKDTADVDMADSVEVKSPGPSEKTEPAAEREPTSEQLENSSRVLPNQLNHISFHKNSSARFVPINTGCSSITKAEKNQKSLISQLAFASNLKLGILVLKDQGQGDFEEVDAVPIPVTVAQEGAAKTSGESEELPLPKEFEYSSVSKS